MHTCSLRTGLNLGYRFFCRIHKHHVTQEMPRSKSSSASCHHGPTNTYNITSPIGSLEVVSCPKGIHSLNQAGGLTDENFKVVPSEPITLTSQLYQDNGNTYKPLTACMKWLHTYFHQKEFIRTMPLPPLCLPANKKDTFHYRVLNNLADKVLYGQVVSYGELAALSGSPKASQSVGTAMKTNPISLIIPCHRVIRSGGTPGQYHGGQRNAVKKWLLHHEEATE